MKRRSSKIKIIVIDKDTNIKLPGMPFWLISSLVSFAFIFKPLLIRANSIDDETKIILQKLDKIMVKEIINELKFYGPFDLVDISQADGTRVKISIL